MSPRERLARAFARAGAGEVLDLAEAQPSPSTDAVVLVRSDAVLDVPVVEALLGAPNVLLLGDDGEPLAAVIAPQRAEEVAAWLERDDARAAPRGLEPVRPQQLCSSHWARLRKREIPYAMRLSPERVGAVEWRIYLGTYKGVTDLVTKWLWPVPAFWGTKLCVRLGITPNVVTLAGLALVVLAFFLFRERMFAAGLAAAWLMALLDTVDGKLARVTMRSSRFGDVLDHGIDLIHPPFWYLAWRLGLDAGDPALPATTLDWALGVTVIGYLLLRAVEGIFSWRYGMHIHVWRRFDSRFRLVVARRNPNLILLTGGALFGRPDLGLLAVAVWTAVSVLVHLVQLGQALHSSRTEGTLRSWLAQDPAT